MGERSKFETHALLDRWPTVRDGGRERVCERTPRADGDGPESRAWVRRTRASTSWWRRFSLSSALIGRHRRDLPLFTFFPDCSHWWDISTRARAFGDRRSRSRQGADRAWLRQPSSSRSTCDTGPFVGSPRLAASSRLGRVRTRRASRGSVARRAGRRRRRERGRIAGSDLGGGGW
jgi:hypothetical protein